MGMSKLYTRSHRHRANNKVRNRRSVRAHTQKGGRSGGVQSKKTHATKHFPYSFHIPNPPFWHCGISFAV